MAHIDLIYYLDVLSSWCYVADRALEQIEDKYAESVRIDWRIAQLFDFGPLPYTPDAMAWYYARTAKMTGVRLNPAWHDTPETTTVFANQAAEAARSLGFTDSRVRRALAQAALIDGKKLGERENVPAEAARITGLPPERIAESMDSESIRSRIERSTQEFAELDLPQRPGFVIRNTSGDLAVCSGLYSFESLDAVIGEMLHASRVTEEFGPGP